MRKLKGIWALIIVSSIVRLVISNSIDLGNDEVYYWTYSRHLAYNYFDHPPMVSWLIWLSTANHFLHDEVFVRLGAIFSSAVCTLLIYKMGSFISSPRTGWYAALLYTASIYASLIAGTFILPDSPQMVFWLAAIFLLLKIRQNGDEKNAWLWCLFGVAAGLCVMSKVHGGFLWIGVLCYAVFYQRNWLINQWLYLSAAITLWIIAPIVIWNIQNNFITYTYHGSRVSLVGEGINLLSFGRELLGEVFYNNPIVFVLICTAIWPVYKRGNKRFDPFITILLFCNLPLIVSVIFVSLFKNTLPHWSGPAYSSLILIAAVQMSFAHPITTPKPIKAALILFITTIVSGLILINFLPGTISNEKTPSRTGRGDFTLDLYGWEQVGSKFDSLNKELIRKKDMSENATIIVNKWFPAAHVDYYTAWKTGQSTFAIGPIADIHQYYIYNAFVPKLEQGSDAYFLVLSNISDVNGLKDISLKYRSVDAPIFIPLYRNSKVSRYLLVYRLHGLLNERSG